MKKRNNKEINEEIFRENWNKGLSDIKLTEIFDCGVSKIQKMRKKLGLPPNKKSVTNTIKISEDDILNLVEQGFTNIEIARKFDCSIATVLNTKKRCGINNRNERENKIIDLSEIQKQVIFGSTMGDAYIYKASKNASIVFQHSLKQKDYVSYLCDFFKDVPHTISQYTKRLDSRTGKIYETYQLNLHTNESFNVFKEMFYRNNKKIIPIDYLELYYTPLAMAIHFCDDGYNDGSGYNLSTCSFNTEDLIEFRKYLFNKYDLDTIITKANRIYIRKNSVEKFKNLIEPYIPECMMYKLKK